MIDTLKVSYPLDRRLAVLLDEKSERLQKVSPDGEVLWEKSVVRGNCMPSHYSGLRITTRKKKDLLDMGFINLQESNLPDVAFFEFSLQKYQSPSAYNNKNTDLDVDIQAFYVWVSALSSALEYDFLIAQFELQRVDFSRNYLIQNSTVLDFLRSLELTFSRHPTADTRLERKGSGLFFKSSWLGKKLYYKYQEFMDVERKKHSGIYTEKRLSGVAELDAYCDFQPLTCAEIDELTRMVRFEIEFKQHYLKRYSVKKIDDVINLLDRFNIEKEKYMEVPLLTKGDLCSSLGLTAAQHQIIDMVRRYGFKEARNQYIQLKSLRSWQRNKSELSAKHIHLEALDNREYRSMTDIFHNPEVLNFQLELAPFQDEFKKAA